MKKSTVKFTTTIILAFAFISIFTFQSCKGSKKDQLIKRPTIVDYQGKREEKEIPDWVKIYLSEPISEVHAKIKPELGLKESDYIYIFESKTPVNKHSLKDALTESKILAYSETILSENQFGTLDENYFSSYSHFFGLVKIFQLAEYGKNLLCYDVSPFGTMKFSSVSNASSGKYKEQRDIEIARKDENGNFIADFEQTGNFEPVSDEMQKIFEWFLDKKNVRIDQFWIELQYPTKESKRKIADDFCAYTVISMSAKSHAWLVNALNAYAENYENMPEYSKIERFIQKEMEKIVKD